MGLILEGQTLNFTNESNPMQLKQNEDMEELIIDVLEMNIPSASATSATLFMISKPLTKLFVFQFLCSCSTPSISLSSQPETCHMCGEVCQNSRMFKTCSHSFTRKSTISFVAQ